MEERANTLDAERLDSLASFMRASDPFRSFAVQVNDFITIYRYINESDFCDVRRVTICQREQNRSLNYIRFIVL